MHFLFSIDKLEEKGRILKKVEGNPTPIPAPACYVSKWSMRNKCQDVHLKNVFKLGYTIASWILCWFTIRFILIIGDGQFWGWDAFRYKFQYWYQSRGNHGNTTVWENKLNRIARKGEGGGANIGKQVFTKIFIPLSMYVFNICK